MSTVESRCVNCGHPFLVNFPVSAPPEPPDGLDAITVEERRYTFRSIRLALKGARGLALDHDETALAAEFARVIDLLDQLSENPDA